NEKIPSNQPIELSYKVEDLDLVDRTFSTKVWLNGQEVYAENNVPNGKMIIQSIPHNMPDGGTATIKIEATDARGAKVTKEFQVVIEKVSANIEVNRAISTTLTPVNEPIAMQYTVTPKPLSLLTNTLLKVTNIAFEEKLPAGIEVVSLPNGFTKQGTVTEGYTIKGTLPDISFVKSGTTYIAEPQTFTIQVKPTAKGTFSLSQAKLTYKDINTQVVNVSFNVVSFVSDYKITDATLPSTIFVNRGVPKNARLLLNVLPQEATIASVEWSENSHGQVISIDQNGVITAIQEGTAQVTAKVKDMFGNVKTTTMTVIVRIPVDSITIQNFTVYVGETIPIPINVSPADAKKAVSYSLGNSLYAEVNGATGTITGLKEGVTTLTVQAFNRNDELIEKTVTVTIEAIPVTAVVVSPTVVNMNIGETATLAATVAPNNATYKTIEWRSSNPNIASVDENGRVTGLSTGQVTITAQAHNGVIGTAIVHVGSPLTGISLPSTLLVQKGKTINVLPYIAPIPANATTKIVSRSFAVGNSYYAVVDQNGEVTAKRLGETPLTVKLVDETGKTWTASTVIRIVEQATDPTKGGNKNGWLY
ncbi:MAG: Ig-like domain-containing protein, partial [Anoxybacillus gonensis]|nr:Ig-like domain-containing protein [Anoxybacillus gonensis]